jgi:hypothetical protein
MLIICARVTQLNHLDHDKTPGQLDVARRRRETPRGLDHFLSESDTFQHDPAGPGPGDARQPGKGGQDGVTLRA